MLRLTETKTEADVIESSKEEKYFVVKDSNSYNSDCNDMHDFSLVIADDIESTPIKL